MKRSVLALLVLLSLLVALPVGAQTQNPTTVVFDHSDYASAASYQGGYFALIVLPAGTCDLASTPAVAPTKTDDLGKPQSSNGVGMSAPLVSRPIGCFVYRVRAVDVSGLISEWSLPSGPFSKLPATPSAVAVK